MRLSSFVVVVIAAGCGSGKAPTPDGGPAPIDASAPETEASAPLVPCEVDPKTAKSQGSCVAIGLDYECNPVTGTGCPSGKTCDFDGLRFRCLDATGAGDACSPCGGNLRCSAGFTCAALESRCSRFCCDDQDCAAGTQCVMQAPTSLGLCQAKNDHRLRDFKRSDAQPVGYVLPVCSGTSTTGTGACIGNESNICNAISGAGCAAGKTCEWYSSSYQCVPSTSTKKLCEPCNGPGDCASGSSCMFGKVCARFCCDDSECGTGKCIKLGGPAGVCAVPPNTSVDGGGTCDLCTGVLCKDALAACSADSTCTPCMGNRTLDGCDTHATYQTLEQCRCEANTCFEHCAAICP